MSIPSIADARLRARGSRLFASTILAFALTPLSWLGAFAQQPAAVTELPVVVVSPTTIPTPIDQIASSVTVITAADIARTQRRTLPEVLDTVPGLNVVQSGGAGGLTSVFMRGTNSNHVKVLVDGIDVSDPSMPNRSFDFGQFLTADIERVEVLRGPQSGLYGSDAIGGVISITTRKGEGPIKATASLEGGSFGAFNQSGSVSGSQERFNYAFNVAHLRSTSTPVTPQDLLPAGRARINDHYDNKTVSSRLGFEATESVSLNWVGRYTDAELRYTGDDYAYYPSVPRGVQSTQVLHQFFTRGEAVWSLADGRFKNFFGVAYTDHWRWNQSPGSDPYVYKGDRIKYDWRGVAQVMPGHTVVMGLDQESERLRNDTINVENGNKGGYVELQSEFAQRIFVVANVRHDDNDSFGGHTTWRVAPAVLVPGTDTKLKASYGTGFKAPSLEQLYVDYPAWFFFGNRDLKPEESSGWEAGFEQPIAGDLLRFGVTYFHNDITNLISSTWTTYVNVDEATTSGIEAFATIAVTSRLKLRGDYTYTKAVDETTGLELLRRPKHKGSVTASWTPIDPLTLSATVLRVGDWIDRDRAGTIARMKAPGYTVVNLAAEYNANRYTTVFGRVDNLFDQRYQNPTGFEKTGIGVFAGVKAANR